MNRTSAEARIEYGRALVRDRLKWRHPHPRRPLTPQRLRPLPDPLPLPAVGVIPHCRVLHLPDFVDLQPWIKLVAPGREPNHPKGREYRKDWETAMTLRAFAATGLLDGTAEILGVGAGDESTIFTLTNYARRVFATDLYLQMGWSESASIAMMTCPGEHFPGPWRSGRLVVQHMDALDLWYEDNMVDGIFSSGSIEHFGDLNAVATAVREMHRVLRPGGVCCVATEFKLAGPPGGMPRTILFTREELATAVLGAAEWEPVGPLDFDPPSIDSLVPADFSEATVDVMRHQRKFGLMAFDHLELRHYPHAALTHNGYAWTSCHLALRKPSA